MESYVLYVAKDKKRNSDFCPGSTVCIGMAEFLPKEVIDVRSCDTLRKTVGKEGIPTWLTGSPTLVSSYGDEVFRGSQAVRKLHNICVDFAYKQGVSDAGGGGGKKTSTQNKERGGIPPPNLQLRQESRQEGKAMENVDYDEELEGIWSSEVEKQDGNDDDYNLSRKITGDDLARAVAGRQASYAQQQQNPSNPPPPPPPEKD